MPTQSDGLGLNLDDIEKIFGVGGSIGSALYGRKEAKKAKKRALSQRDRAMALVRDGASTAKADIGIREGEYRAGAQNDLLRRGITGTSAYDAALNQSFDRQNRAGAEIDARTSSQLAGLMGDFTDIYDPRAINASLASLGSGLASVVTGINRDGTNKPGQSKDPGEQSPASQAVANMDKQASGAPIGLPGGGMNLSIDAFNPGGTGLDFGTPGWSGYSDALKPEASPRRRRRGKMYDSLDNSVYDFAAGMP
jgi:hypothetical protein